MFFLELKIPPPLVWLILAALMYVMPEEASLIPAALTFHYALIGGCVAIGFVMVLLAIRRFFVQKTTTDPRDPSKTSALVTSGIFRYSRNPMYLGLFFFLLAFALALGKPFSFLALPIFVGYLTRFQIIPEERLLRKNFGADYAGYCQRVRRWL